MEDLRSIKDKRYDTWFDLLAGAVQRLQAEAGTKAEKKVEKAAEVADEGGVSVINFSLGKVMFTRTEVVVALSSRRQGPPRG